MVSYEAILNKSKEIEPQIADFLSRLIKCRSHSGTEKDVVDLIKEEMEKLKYDEIRVDALGSIIGRVGSGPRLIAIDAHIDTVYEGNLANWDKEPFSGEIDEKYVYGRGTSDQKSGLASMVYAGWLMKEFDLLNDFTVLITGTVMEEDCDGIAWEHLIVEDGIKPELVISTEPTSCNIYRGHRGRMEISIEVKGISCHGSAPERGDNAIYKMSRIALEIEKLNERLKHDDFLGKGTITVSVMKSDSPSQCAVSDYVYLQCDRRLTDGETKEIAVNELKECCRMAGYPEAEVKVLEYKEKAYTGKVYPVEKYYPTWVLSEDSNYLKVAKKGYSSIFTNEPLVDKWTFSTNCVFIMGKHPEIKCLGFGPGDEDQAHAPNEKVKREDLWKATAFYTSYIKTLKE